MSEPWWRRPGRVHPPKLTAAQREMLTSLLDGPRKLTDIHNRRILCERGLAIGWFQGSTKITPAGRKAVDDGK